jgi:four helix bundle protein
MFRFRKLEIWRKSADFAGVVYEATEAFPRKEQFGLTSQLRRAAVSISANIAEGSSRSSDRDFSRFIEIAFGSLCETLSHAHVARGQEFLSEDQYLGINRAAEELGRMLSAFREKLGEWKAVTS